MPPFGKVDFGSFGVEPRIGEPLARSALLGCHSDRWLLGQLEQAPLLGIASSGPA